MLLDFVTAVFLGIAERLGFCPKTPLPSTQMLEATDASLADFVAQYRATNHLNQARHVAYTEHRYPGYRDVLNRERARVGLTPL
jgi:hypothetical protein